MISTDKSVTLSWYHFCYRYRSLFIQFPFYVIFTSSFFFLLNFYSSLTCLMNFFIATSLFIHRYFISHFFCSSFPLPVYYLSFVFFLCFVYVEFSFHITLRFCQQEINKIGIKNDVWRRVSFDLRWLSSFKVESNYKPFFTHISDIFGYKL